MLSTGHITQSTRSFLPSLRLQGSTLTRKALSCTNASEEILVNYHHMQDHVPTGVVTVTLNRTLAANALGRNMLLQLESCIARLTDDSREENVRCVILSSASHKVFSAGADLKERRTMTQAEASAFVTKLRNTFQQLASLPMPLIASVEGVCVGGGLELALTADIIVAGNKSTFGLPETSLAIIPGAGGTVRLPRKIGLSRAKELIFTAKKINAHTAHSYGLVDHLVGAEQADSYALELALQICKNGPLALQAAKKAIETAYQAQTLLEALDAERLCYESIIPTRDRLEGLAAFAEKRNPIYTGR